MKKITKIWIAAGMAGVLMMGTGCGQEQEEKSSNQVTVFESFTAQDLEGNEVTQDIFADYDVTMINIWGTFCGPCLEEMPELGEIAEEYEDKGFQIVGICSDAVDLDGNVLNDVVQEAQADIQETGADYLHILPTGEIFTDLMPRVTAVPTTIFVDQNGRQLGLAIMGANDKDGWIEVIDEKLAEVQQGE